MYTSGAMAISIAKPSTTSVNQSLAVVLSADQKTPLTAEQITPGKRVTEQDCYAALVHQSLMATHPKAVRRFEQELKQATETYKKNHGDVNLFKVSDRLMRQYVRDKEISQEQYRLIRDHAFGHAQLDSDRTRLSAERAPETKGDDTPLRAVSTFHSKLETNQAATSGEIAQFRANEATISVQKWRERKQTGGFEQTAALGTEAAGITETATVDSMPAGFLWKPKSDSDGRLVVLLPPGFSSSVHSLTVKDPKGTKVIEEGKFAGIANGGRLHFRFQNSGATYPDGSIVEVTLIDGSTLRIPIKETSARIESS